MQIAGVLETCLCVADLAAAEDFYRRVLGLTLFESVAGRHVFFRCGGQMLLLFDPRATQIVDGRIPPHGTHGSGHVAFAVAERDLPAWQAHLSKQKVALETTIDWPGGGRSLYFRDPSGNSVELATPKIWGLTESFPIRPRRAGRPHPKSRQQNRQKPAAPKKRIRRI